MHHADGASGAGADTTIDAVVIVLVGRTVVRRRRDDGDGTTVVRHGDGAADGGVAVVVVVVVVVPRWVAFGTPGSRCRCCSHANFVFVTVNCTIVDTTRN